MECSAALRAADRRRLRLVLDQLPLSYGHLPIGAGVSDVREAIRFVKAHAADYHVDLDRIALLGESAGGQLAPMAVLGGRPDTSVKAVVALYTPSGLVSLAESSTYIPASVRNSIHGTADAMVPFAQSRDMCNRMHQAGASCELYSVEGRRSWPALVGVFAQIGNRL